MTQRHAWRAREIEEMEENIALVAVARTLAKIHWLGSAVSPLFPFTERYLERFLIPLKNEKNPL